MTRCGVLLLVAALTACGLEFIGPESRASLTASVDLIQRDTASVSISARLEPGYSLDDLPRRVAADTIQIMGFSLGPWAMNHEGTRLYSNHSVVNPDSLSEPAVSLLPPTIQGLASPGMLALNLATRGGPFNLASSNGADITLMVVPPSPDSADQISWSLSVSVTGREFLILSGNGAPPAQMIVPGSMTTDPEISALEVRLWVSSSSLRINDMNDYGISMLARSTISWAVTLSPP